MKRLVKHFAQVVVLFGISKLIYLVLAVVMSRKLGVEGVGRYGFILAFIGLFFMGAGIGRGVAVRDFAADKNNKRTYFWNFLLLRVVMSIIVFAFLVIAINLYTTSLETRIAVYIMGLTLFFSIFSHVTTGVFYATEHFGLVLMTGLAGDVVTGGMAILFLLMGKGLLWVFIGFVLGEATSAGIGITVLYTNKHFTDLLYKYDYNRLIPPKLFRIDIALWQRIVKQGSYFLLQSIIRLGMFQTDIIVVTFFGGAVLTGFYQAAYKTSFSTCLLSSALVFAMYPYYASKFVNSPKLLKKNYFRVSFYNLIIAVLMYSALVLFAGVIVRYVYGSDFAPAVGVIKIIAIATILNAFNLNNSTFLNAIKKENMNTAFVLLAFIINAVLDVVLFKPYGMKGVALATVFCSLSYSVLSTALILRETKTSVKARKTMA
ncbi:MAG: flippase [Nanoarchaeota archaeon]|nr:flippase [Nanoarchaeota archaeon]